MVVSGTAGLAGVMGWPVGHSLSPRVHGYWLRHHGIDGAYVPLAVKPGDFEDALAMLPRLGFRGANITVPHKEAALAVMDELDAEARRAGAVNTVVVGADGALLGRNTDGFGLVENLKSGGRGWRAETGPAVVLGAGGAARAVAAALLDQGVPELRLVNRTLSRAERLVEHLGGPIEAIPWRRRARALEDAALLVNTTVLGMAGNPSLSLDLGRLPKDATVTDIVYRPLETALLKAAAARGNPVVDGLGMLLHQARPGFGAWFGVEPEVTEDLRKFVMQELAR